MRGFVSHVDLTVSNLHRSREFYDKVLVKLGYTRQEDVVDNISYWQIEHAGVAFSIGLHLAKSATPHNRYAAGLHHLAFYLMGRDEIDEFHQFLVAEGISIMHAPREYDYAPGYYATFFADPDGMKLEVVFLP
jgi:glyoxylase I family protein